MTQLLCCFCRNNVTVVQPIAYINLNCPICFEDVKQCAVFSCGHVICKDCPNKIILSARTEQTVLTQEIREPSPDQEDQLSLWRNIFSTGINIVTETTTLTSNLVSSLINEPLDGTRQPPFTLGLVEVTWQWNREFNGWILLDNRYNFVPWQGWEVPPLAIGMRNIRWVNRKQFWISW